LHAESELAAIAVDFSGEVFANEIFPGLRSIDYKIPCCQIYIRNE